MLTCLACPRACSGVPATPSPYMAMCLHRHMPADVDLVIVEFNVRGSDSGSSRNTWSAHAACVAWLGQLFPATPLPIDRRSTMHGVNLIRPCVARTSACCARCTSCRTCLLSWSWWFSGGRYRSSGTGTPCITATLVSRRGREGRLLHGAARTQAAPCDATHTARLRTARRRRRNQRACPVLPHPLVCHQVSDVVRGLGAGETNEAARG